MDPLFKLIQTDDAAALGAFKTAEGAGDSFGPDPVIVPFSQSAPQLNISADNLKSITTLNVTDSFQWTNAPPLTHGDEWNARYDIPSLDLREESIQLNPSLNNLARQLFIAKDNLDEIERLLEKAKKLGTSAAGATGGAAGTGLAIAYLAHRAGLGGSAALLTGTAGGVAGSLGLDITAIAKSGADVVNTVTAGAGAGGSGQSKSNIHGKGFQDYDQYLAPYRDMYTTKLTGWRYKLPYLTDQQRKSSSSYSSADISKFGGVAELASKAVRMTTAIQAITSPGVYVDNAKSFNFGQDEKQYTVEFPLLNTGDPRDIIRNWQLLFLLTYQNRPNRIDRVQIAPPKIYQAMIPGVWYSKHAYISNISIDFVGNRRKMTLLVPVVKQKQGVFSQTEKQKTATSIHGWAAKADQFIGGIFGIKPKSYGTSSSTAAQNSTLPVTTIIPDAYNVSITLKELIPESQNTMFAAIHKPNTVTVSSSEQSGSDMLENGKNFTNR